MAEPSIHVMHVVPGLGPGGMELAMARLVRGIQTPDVRHTVVCLKGEAVIRDQFPAGVDIHCMYSKPNELALPFRLRRLIRQVRPTVIHARNWGAWPDVALARLLTRPRVPLVFSFHGFARTERPPLRRRVAFRLLARMTTHLLTVCDAARQMLVREFGWPAGKVRVIPNGVDLAKFCPGPDQRRVSGRLLIGCIGGLTAVKNHGLMLRALAGLVERGADCELRIAGEGPERPMLEGLAAELGIASRVVFAGQVADVPALLRQFDLFVLPSASEAHPNALLEAMACGVPCVATDVGGVAEVLDSGACGLVVPPGDPEALANALHGLCVSAEERRRLAQAGRRRAVEQYSMEKMTADYEALYREASAWARGKTQPAKTTPAPSAKIRVLQLGPLPPLTGGMATVANNLLHSDLADFVDLAGLNNGKTTPPGRSLLAGVWAQVRLLVRVVSAVCRRRVQVVHIHSCALFSFWRDIFHMLAVRALGCRVIWHLHDGTFQQFISEGSRIKRAIIRWALARGSAVIVLSDESLRNLRPHAPKVNWRAVPNGVPLQECPSRNGSCAGAAGAGLKLLFLGNLTRRKGAYDLIAAVEATAAQGVRPTLMLAGGEVEPGQRREIEQRIAASPCASQVRLLGMVGGQQKQAALEVADCIVLPSYAEGLPMALLEGMAVGMPAIASDVGSIPALVQDGVAGFLVRPGDVAGLAERICRLARDHALRSRMGQAARRRVEDEFSQRAMAEKVYRIYVEAVTGSPRAMTP